MAVTAGKVVACGVGSCACGCGGPDAGVPCQEVKPCILAILRQGRAPLGDILPFRNGDGSSRRRKNSIPNNATTMNAMTMPPMSRKNDIPGPD